MLSLLVLVCCLSIASSLTTSEITALNAFYDSMAHPPPTWNKTKTASACTLWKSVFCSSSGHVTAFGGFDVTNPVGGSIPTHIGLLTYLNTINFIAQNFQGTIPTTLGTLPAIQTLFLSFNQLSGQIPSNLMTLSTLESLFLNANQISGTIPSAANFFYLKSLNLGQNKLTGTIPKGMVSTLKIVESLDLSENQLSGTLPSEMNAISTLLDINLSNNQLTGPLPRFLSTNLSTIQFSKNQFSGPISNKSLGSLSILRTLDLSFNQLTGNLPEELGSLTLLNIVKIQNNSFSGSLPAVVFVNRSEYKGTPNGITWLDMSYNYFTGNLPMMSNVLGYMDISYNYFNGNITTNPIYFPPDRPNNPYLKTLYYNQICCCSAACLGCSQVICPQSLGVSVNPNGTTVVNGTVTTTGINNGGTLNVTNATVNSGSIVNTNQTNVQNSTVNTGVLVVTSGQVVLTNTNLSAGTVNVGGGGSIALIGNSTLNATAYSNCGELVFSGNGPIVLVGCMDNCPTSSLTIDLGGATGSYYRIPIVISKQGCITGAFGDVHVVADNCYEASILQTQYQITAIVVPCSPPVGLLVGVIVAGAAVFLVFLIAIISYWHSSRSFLFKLPSGVRWQWEQYYLQPALWKKKGKGTTEVFYKKLRRGTGEWNHMVALLNNSLHGSDLKIKSAHCLFNKTLVQNFVNAREIRKSRVKNSPSLFERKTWVLETDPATQLKQVIQFQVNNAITSSDDQSLLHFQKSGKLQDLAAFDLNAFQTGQAPGLQCPSRQWVYQKYTDKVNACGWNDGETVPILPAAHGNDKDVAWKIAQTGFASLSLLDKGFYGKGIYFSSYAFYCFPYFSGQKSPTVLVSFVLPGNVFPVTEHHSGFNSRMGAAIEAGYDSHYVVTNGKGQVPASMDPDDTYFDEFVIPQENSIAPAYLVTIDNSNFHDLSSRWLKISTVSKREDDKKITKSKSNSSEIIEIS